MKLPRDRSCSRLPANADGEAGADAPGFAIAAASYALVRNAWCVALLERRNATHIGRRTSGATRTPTHRHTWRAPSRSCLLHDPRQRDRSRRRFDRSPRGRNVNHQPCSPPAAAMSRSGFNRAAPRAQRGAGFKRAAMRCRRFDECRTRSMPPCCHWSHCAWST